MWMAISINPPIRGSIGGEVLTANRTGIPYQSPYKGFNRIGIEKENVVKTYAVSIPL